MEKSSVISLPAGSPKLLLALYEAIAHALGADGGDDDLCYDCTKVNISADLQDEIYEAYRAEYIDEYRRTPGSFDAEVAMLLARSGPKVDRALPMRHAEVFDGFLCNREGGPLDVQYL